VISTDQFGGRSYRNNVVNVVNVVDAVNCFHPCDGSIPACDNVLPIEQLPEVKDEYPLIRCEKVVG
jgi:hypothetical protein